MSTWCWVIAYHLFVICNFWSVAVNIVDKQLFFIIIFVVLLPISVLFIALRLGPLCISTLKFCWKRSKSFWDIVIFWIFQMAIGHHIEFVKLQNFIRWGVWGTKASPYQFVFKIGQFIAEILQFFKMTAVHHLAFVSGICGPPTEIGSLSLCKIWLWSMQQFW